MMGMIHDDVFLQVMNCHFKLHALCFNPIRCTTIRRRVSVSVSRYVS